MKSAKKRSKSVSDTESEFNNQTTFNKWFGNKVLNGELNFWQRDEILTFFKEKDLKEIEDSNRYDEILKLY